MNLAPTDQQMEIASAVDAALEGGIGHRASSPWEAGARLGWLGLGVPERFGGAGLGAVEETILFRRVGQRLAEGPLRSTVIAAHACVLADETRLVIDLVSGARRCGLIVGGIGLDLGIDDMALSIAGDEIRLFEGFDVEPISGVEAGVPTVLVTGGIPIVELRAPALVARARLIVAAEALGVIDAVCEMSAAYARDRVQFGVPIGSFQAVKHRCAEIAVVAYAAEAQVAFAARRLDGTCADSEFQCAAAHLLAVTAAPRAAADNIQNHGAIGFTMEHPAHLYLRRAHTLQWALGPTMDCARAVLAPARHEFD